MSYIGSTPANKLVTSSDMEDGIVSTDKLAANAVTTAKITDGTIAETDIANDAVTADKIANAVNSAISANTAKTTNATHSGEVTGSGALTIADNVVDEANLKVSNSPTNGYFLAAQSGNTGGLTWQEAGGGDNTPVFRAYRNGSQALANNSDVTIIFNVENFDPQGTYNTSNGKFTPAVAGKYLLYTHCKFSASSDQSQHELYIKKNSSIIAAHTLWSSSNNSIGIQVSDIFDSDTNDEFTIQLYQNTGVSGITAASGSNQTWFSAFKIIE